jgi:hypothetical protein
VQLRLVKQPEIELIHQRARQRLEQFKRRTRVRTPSAVPVAAQEFSYAQDDFRPLGLQLFHARAAGAAAVARRGRRPAAAARAADGGRRGRQDSTTETTQTRR